MEIWSIILLVSLCVYVCMCALLFSQRRRSDDEVLMGHFVLGNILTHIGCFFLCHDYNNQKTDT